MLGAQAATHECALMVDLNLCQIARIVEDVDLFTDEGRQGRFDIVPPHEADAVTCDLPWFWHAQEQHIQDVTAFRKRR